MGTLTRLSKGKKTEQLYKEGKRLVYPKWVLIYCRNNSEIESQFAVHIRKKFGNAVERNRIRRQVREAVRLTQKTKIPFDFIIIPRSSVKGIKTIEIKNQFEKLFQQLSKME